MTTQRIGKYACLESERRFLLRDLPNDFNETQGGWQITDIYFANTRLRLRQMQSIHGSEIIYKLTQKYRSADQTAAETTITNLYLTVAEYRLLLPLEGAVLQKKRLPYAAQDRTYSIDIFEGRHRGLLLAELEYDPGSGEPSLPNFAAQDVTDDPFFAGGNLAMLTDEALRQGLTKYTQNLI